MFEKCRNVQKKNGYRSGAFILRAKGENYFSLVEYVSINSRSIYH
jgi:hypothetical protein